MKAVLSACALLLMVLSGVPAYALEALVLYDDFNAAHLDPTRWSLVAGWGDASTEAIRKIQDHRLRLVYRSYAKTDSDSERLGHGEALFFPNPASITAIQARSRSPTRWLRAVAATPRLPRAGPG